MKSLPELIHDYKSGVPGTDAKILQRMQPLIKGTAAKIHCMEREDSQQELYLSLLQAIPYLNEDSSEGECVKYIPSSNTKCPLTERQCPSIYSGTCFQAVLRKSHASYKKFTVQRKNSIDSACPILPRIKPTFSVSQSFSGST
mgnify:CR=1 FL=1